MFLSVATAAWGRSFKKKFQSDAHVMSFVPVVLEIEEGRVRYGPWKLNWEKCFDILIL
jgi:hypothetical protein